MHIRSFIIAGILALTSTFSQDQIPGAIQRAHNSTHHIAEMTAIEKDLCSATAVGPHAILTATHCELGTDTLYIEGQKNPAHIEGHIRDEHDHTILLLSGITFPSFAQIDISNDERQGEDVFVFGNPGNWSDIYRRGYVSGTIDDGEITQVLFDLTAWHGDSGAAIFDSNGRIVAVLTGIDKQEAATGGSSIQMVFAFTFAFHQCDLDVARTYGVEK